MASIDAFMGSVSLTLPSLLPPAQVIRSNILSLTQRHRIPTLLHMTYHATGADHRRRYSVQRHRSWAKMGKIIVIIILIIIDGIQQHLQLRTCWDAYTCPCAVKFLRTIGSIVNPPGHISARTLQVCTGCILPISCPIHWLDFFLSLFSCFICLLSVYHRSP